MAGRKKKEVVEESTLLEPVVKKPAVKKPAAKKPKVAEVVAEVKSPETVGVPVEMLSQLMAQIQTLTQEVGQLKAQVHEPLILDSSAPCEVVEVESLVGVTQAEIDEAQENPDLMPDNFFAEELEDEPVVPVPIDIESFESQNPGLLAEIESFNDGPGIEVREALSLGELTQNEIDEATANPQEMPADFYNQEIEDVVSSDIPDINVDEFETQNPGLLAEIESFNLSSETDSDEDVAITAEEAGALLAGFDEVMNESESGEETGDGELSADEIAAMFASSEVVETVPADLGGDEEVSAEVIEAMFASAESTESAPADALSSEEISADDIAAMFASAGTDEPVDQVEEASLEGTFSPVDSAENLSDDDIAAAIDAGADMQPEPVEAESSGFGGFDYSDDDLDGLSEADLVALVRQSIDSQAEELDAAAESAELGYESEDLEVTAEDDDGNGVMSAAEIAALLETPDAEGDVVPTESSAMSDEELRALLMDSTSGESDAAVPTADDISESFLSVESNEETVAEPVKASQTKPKVQESVGNEPEIGAIKAVPSHLAIRAMALPMQFVEGKILCLVAEPVDQTAIDRLSKETGFGIIVEKAPIDQVIAGLRSSYAELHESTARFAVMAGAQKRPTFVEKIAGMWKKSA